MNWGGAEKRAFRSSEKLAKLRSEITVVESQIEALRQDADEAHLMELVTENPADRREDIDTARHLKALEGMRATMTLRLERNQERHQLLLGRLFPDGDL
ncbi:MAG TPA: hypothetical protein VMU77_01300 [Acidimicrobiales bacterium]|nr:hypothetical protein [Acidimicrobiales bacterium]